MSAKPAQTKFVSMNFTVPARTTLKRVTLNHSAAIGERIAMSAVLLAALEVAERHSDEFQAAIRNQIGDSE